MSNIERAADVIDQWTQEGYELNSAVGSPHAIAERLAAAGLLAPDLPQPAVHAGGLLEWDTPRGYVHLNNGEIEVAYDHPAAPSLEHNTLRVPDRKAAKALVLALLAAATHPEDRQA